MRGGECGAAVPMVHEVVSVIDLNTTCLRLATQGLRG